MADYNRLKKAELRRLCSERGISVARKKKGELIRMLEAADDVGEERVNASHNAGVNLGSQNPENEYAVGGNVSFSADDGLIGTNSNEEQRGRLPNEPGSGSSREDQNLRIQLEIAQVKAQTARIQAEAEVAKIQAESEAARIDLEKLRLEHEFRLRRLEMEGVSFERARSRDTVGIIPAVSVDISKVMPKFEDDKTEIDLYLQSFEKVCRLQDWPVDVWARKLPPLLSGKSFVAYSRLSESDSRSYEAIKEALLAAYRISPEQYRVRFRRVRKEQNESYSEMACRVNNSMSAWLNSKGAATLDDVKELIALEQFFKCLPGELLTWLNDRSPTSLKEAARLADEFIAHRPALRKPEPNPEIILRIEVVTLVIRERISVNRSLQNPNFQLKDEHDPT